MKRNKKNYGIYVLMLLVFGGLIYVALQTGERFSAHAVAGQLREGAFGMRSEERRVGKECHSRSR